MTTPPSGDYRRYLETLHEQATRHGCAIHAYVLMTNHVHLLLTPQRPDGAGLLMKHLGQRYVQYINRTYRRSGTLWEGRFRSCLAQREDYVLSCYRYIELNPVRAGMVRHPRDYRWSSYRANGEGQLPVSPNRFDWSALAGFSGQVIRFPQLSRALFIGAAHLS